MESVNKSDIIFPRHADIDIVVPRNKTMMPDSTQKGTARKTIANIILFAEFVYLEQNI